VFTKVISNPPLFFLSFFFTLIVDIQGRLTAAVFSMIPSVTVLLRGNAVACKSLADTAIDAFDDDSEMASHAGFEVKERRRVRRQLSLVEAGTGKEGHGGIKVHILANCEYYSVFSNLNNPTCLCASILCVNHNWPLSTARVGALVLRWHASSPNQEPWPAIEPKEANRPDPLQKKVSELPGRAVAPPPGQRPRWRLSARMRLRRRRGS
jgi:hypothetical protein